MDRKRNKHSMSNKIKIAQRLHETLIQCYIHGKSAEYTKIVKQYNNVTRQLSNNGRKAA